MSQALSQLVSIFFVSMTLPLQGHVFDFKTSLSKESPSSCCQAEPLPVNAVTHRLSRIAREEMQRRFLEFRSTHSSHLSLSRPSKRNSMSLVKPARSGQSSIVRTGFLK